MDRDAVADAPAASPTTSSKEKDAARSMSAEGDRRVLAVLCLASFLAVINFAAPTPFFPAMARDLGTTVPLLGQLTTAMTLLSAALGLAIGPVADRYGHRRLVVGGMVAVAVNLVGTGLAPSYPVLLALAVVGGLGDAVLFGLPLAIAGTHFAGDARRRAVAWTSAALPAGSVAGVPLVAAIGGVVGWRPVIGGAGVATLAVAWLAAAWLPRAAPPPAGSSPPQALLAAYRPLLRHRPLLVLYAANGLRMACWIGSLTFLGAFLTEERGFGAGGVSLAYLAGGVGAVLGSLAAAGRLGRLPRRPLVAAATAANGAVLGAVYLLPLGSPATLALLPLATCLGSAAGVVVALLLARETPAGAATTMVLNGSVLNLGSAIGGALGGLLLARGGYDALGLGLPLFAVAAALLMWAPVGGRTRPRPGA